MVAFRERECRVLKIAKKSSTLVFVFTISTMQRHLSTPACLVLHYLSKELVVCKGKDCLQEMVLSFLLYLSTAMFVESVWGRASINNHLFKFLLEEFDEGVVKLCVLEFVLLILVRKFLAVFLDESFKLLCIFFAEEGLLNFLDNCLHRVNE
eukprot:CAMPEP_0113908356 /NCGR_PEP_ID=MMETSP0780_2-20120614/26109_1 /TAXON_ID=652834 /ORGANISM="Palpitomonas bilix" /LENGTH=151 /DNA_ID=CAMNT_0000903761 /DNA_START=805 /DNA_END=1260 /DNA_ORIENTATION=- /assembly_acc=CAM_ASM_000599